MKDTISIRERHPFDWSEVRRRIEAARAALDDDRQPSEEQRAAILRSRARELAREPEREADAGQNLEAVEFVLARERYAIESSYVAEVCPMKDLTPLPCTPAFVAGIMNVRGRVVSVIDIKRMLDLPAEGPAAESRIIIARSGDMEMGILADAVPGMRSISPEELQTALPALAGARSGYLKGVTSDRLAVLDGAKLLADESLIVYEEVE